MIGRILRDLLAAISLLLLIATLFIWVRSHWVRDTLWHVRSGEHQWIAQSLLGNLHILMDLDLASTGGSGHRVDKLAPDAIWSGGMSGYPPQVKRHLGFVWQTYTRAHYMSWDALRPPPPLITRHRLIVVPYWMLASVLAILPLYRAMVFGRRLGRSRKGLCSRCGYDLRATPDRCPECGAVADSR